MGVRNDVNDVTEFARLDGYTGERDRLCRFHRHRDVVIGRSRGLSGRLLRFGYLDGSDSAVAPGIQCPVGRRELLRRGPGLQSFPASLNSALAVLRSLAEPRGSPPGSWTVTLQSELSLKDFILKPQWPTERQRADS